MSNLSNYNIRFEISKDDGIKSMNSINTWLDAFVYQFNNLESVDRLILWLNELIDGISEEVEMPTKSLYLGWFDSTTSRIYSDMDAWYDDNTILPDFELPTSDFIEILEAWKEFKF